ncbi:D-alanyl-D-alanine carboxypeptidase [Paenibacillus nanensis]|uniref:D-alanyl-D-alanine carboxypeptidase n=1 Tax=Paenibacillus nanensis TaxID=393251 RepID=A0A3A1UT48_9BACL|nr:D-alanyl-D-alanine carboxypeptidase family protein [Paenibacillus nanensis]RIX50601.1 D-alanyl-D-alanine carboxypeptidase [Paenibacillus nanensis]
MKTVKVRTHSSYNGIRIVFIMVIAAAILFGGKTIRELWRGEEPQIESAAAFLIDAGTGEVLYEKNADEPLPPASMSKMMTEVLVLDYVHDGRIRWSDTVIPSAYAAQVPGARMGIMEGYSLTVRELFDAMAIYSANDAAVALAEHIAGTEAAFTAMMNEKARSIGLSKDAVFGNATGLSRDDIREYEGAASERDTLLTAKDTARLAGYLIGKYPEVLQITSMGSVKVSTQGQALAATNQMLAEKRFEYPGNDGLKTGYTPDAGYCFTGTVKQGGRRLISVVMGADSMDARFIETKKLFEYGLHTGGTGELKTALGY